MTLNGLTTVLIPSLVISDYFVLVGSYGRKFGLFRGIKQVLPIHVHPIHQRRLGVVSGRISVTSMRARHLKGVMRKLRGWLLRIPWWLLRITRRKNWLMDLYWWLGLNAGTSGNSWYVDDNGLFLLRNFLFRQLEVLQVSLFLD